MTPPRIGRLQVRKYRALRNLELADLSPLTVLLGPNGSGKSTVFDVFAFLAECFTDGLRRAVSRRGDGNRSASFQTFVSGLQALLR